MEIDGTQYALYLRSPKGLLADIFNMITGGQCVYRVKFWRKSGDQFLRKWGSNFKLCARISPEWGVVGGRIVPR